MKDYESLVEVRKEIAAYMEFYNVPMQLTALITRCIALYDESIPR